MAQGVDPEFKPQYCIKRKEKISQAKKSQG
jgi:hypothetical protein